jgi:16S rRNA (cytosine967-C5)-methyltransferase
MDQQEQTPGDAQSERFPPEQPTARELLPESPRHDDLRGHVLEVLARCYATPVPPDALLARYFRLRGTLLPPSVKGFIAATMYALLRKRHRTLLLWQWGGVQSPRFEWDGSGGIETGGITPGEEAALGLARWMMEDLGANGEKAIEMTRRAIASVKDRPIPKGESPIPTLGKPIRLVAEFSKALAETDPLAGAPPEVRRAAEVSFPIEILNRWVAQWGEEEAMAIARSLGSIAPLDLRVNTLRTTREECLALLTKDRLDPEPSRLAPDGLRVGRKSNLFRHDAFEQGWFEVQDEGSQLVACAVDPHPNWRVLDACAGGGGKTLHLAALMRNKGEVFAHDRDVDRLEGLRKRLKRAGANNVRVLDPGTAADRAPYDAVLIDAPCLGLGTLRRNPDFAWRGRMADRLAEVTTLQRECVETYAPLVKPGGILVYATCSFEPEETAHIVSLSRMRELGFEPDGLATPFEKTGVPLKADAHDFLLLPHRHGTDGFWMARFKRVH